MLFTANRMSKLGEQFNRFYRVGRTVYEFNRFYRVVGEH